MNHFFSVARTQLFLFIYFFLRKELILPVNYNKIYIYIFSDYVVRIRAFLY